MNRRWRPGVAAVLVALATGGCGGDEALPSDTRPPIVDPTAPNPSTTVATVETTSSIAGVAVGLEVVATLDEPTALAIRPGVTDRVYVAEREGGVQELSLESGEATPVFDIEGDVSLATEQGLLGLTFSLGGDALYLSYTNPDGDTRVDEYAFGDDGLDEGSRRLIFALDQPFPNHNGGNILFGPDGYLYLGLGDGGAAGDPLEAGQDRGQLLGSILRIDPTGDNGSAYAVPSDNPFVGTDAHPEVWLKGVRNPWRFSFDRATGDLWIGDVGQDEVEEIDLLPAGPDGTGAGRAANLGWNEMEGGQPYDDGVEPADHTPPVHTYDHADGGCSVTGGYAYRGTAIPDLIGAYLYTDHCLGDLRALLTRNGEVVEERSLGPIIESPSSFGEGPDGELYVLSLTGDVLRIVPA